tara:strand:- start:1012 stop:1482 length:471 start_codon:yes stop_codon:yes gene_type:complete
MSLLDVKINLDEIPENTGFAPIPAGTYPAMIADAEVKDTKAGDGQFIKVQLNITGANHPGRSVFANFNIRNPNPKAEEIGMQQLKQLTNAIGLAGELLDTQQLVGGSCGIVLAVTKSEQYGDGNEVKRFVSDTGRSQGSANAEPTGSQPKSPWQKK